MSQVMEDLVLKKKCSDVNTLLKMSVRKRINECVSVRLTLYLELTFVSN